MKTQLQPQSLPVKPHAPGVFRPKVRKVRGLDAFIVKFPNGAMVWTSARLEDHWQRPPGELLHPLLLTDCEGEA